MWILPYCCVYSSYIFTLFPSMDGWIQDRLEPRRAPGQILDVKSPYDTLAITKNQSGFRPLAFVDFWKFHDFSKFQMIDRVCPLGSFSSRRHWIILRIHPSLSWCFNVLWLFFEFISQHYTEITFHVTKSICFVGPEIHSFTWCERGEISSSLL